MTLRARPEPGQVLRPEGPTQAAHLQALPKTEEVLPEQPGGRGRLPTQAQVEAAQRPAEVEAEAVRLQEAAGAALPRAAAEAALPSAAVRPPVEQAVAEHRAHPRPETALLAAAARPTSMSARCLGLGSLPAARPKKARLGPSPMSVARPARAAQRPADPS